MNYLELKFTFDAIVNLRNEFKSQEEVQLWARMEYGILVPIQTLFQHFPNFWVYKMSDITKQNFSSKLAFD